MRFTHNAFWFDFSLSHQISEVSRIFEVTVRAVKEAVMTRGRISAPCVRACTDLRNMPPSKEALRHSGGDSLLFTSAMVTLYLEVELSSESRPGTEQNRSVGFTTHVPPAHKRQQQHRLLERTPAWTGSGVARNLEALKE